jgi:predicted metal-binding membrane protein
MSHAITSRSVLGTERLLVLLLGALVAVCWLALWVWGTSPAAGYLDHAGLVRGVDAGERALFVGGWTLMTVAMMLPTSVPLVATFAALTQTRPRRGVLVALLVGGYLATWIGFGWLVHVLDGVLHGIVAAVPVLQSHAYVISAATLVGAGLYQFAPLKYRCLDACRSPLGFVLAHWRGTSPRREALEIGIRHGIFCVGCCWSLMLVMFAVGVGNLAWMIGLGALMAIEKNASWGKRLSRPVGLVLILAGVASLSV